MTRSVCASERLSIVVNGRQAVDAPKARDRAAGCWQMLVTSTSTMLSIIVNSLLLLASVGNISKHEVRRFSPHYTYT